MAAHGDAGQLAAEPDRLQDADRAVVAGVYPELEAGAYDVWGVHGEIVGQVVIVGGKVTEYDAGRCGEPCV